jgi:PAS domain S-box-containing protein
MSKPTRTIQNGKTIGFQAILTDITERKRAQDTAEMYSQFLEAIIENIPEPIVIKGKDSKHLIVNKAHLELTGKTRNETIGKTDYELYTKDQAERFRREDERVITGDKTIVLPELILDDENGLEHILHCRKTPLRNAEGNISHIISIANDITESKKMEASLRESEEKYRAIVENSPSLILILQEGTIKYVNEFACKKSGWTFEELTSPSFNFIEKAVAKEFQGLIKDNIMKRLQGETIPPYEINLLSQDGSEFPVLVRAQRILYRGQPADLVILTDITELKKAEEELAEYSELLGNVLSSMTDYVYVFDEDYTIRFINETARKKYGYTLGDKCFKAIRNRDSPCHHSGIPCEIHEILEKGKDHFEDTRHDTNGILTNMLARPITVDGRKAVIFVSRDITELKRSEEELKRSMSILHTTLESTADGILVVNKDGKISNYNQRFVMMFHIPEPVMKSQDDRQLIEIIQKQVKDPEVYYKRTRELYANPELERFDLLEFKDGRVFERYSRPHQIGEEVIGRVISFRDVTERKRSEEALRSSEEFSLSLLTNSPNPILVVNPDTSIRYVNPALERITGYSSSEVVGGKPPYPWWPKESIERVTKRLKDHMVGEARYYEERWQRKNGEYFWVEINAATPKKNGLIQHYLSSWVDITERKKMEEELKRYSEHLQELVKEKSRDLADSEERYRRLVDESPQAIHVHCEGKFVYVNAAAVKLFGAERPEQLIGKLVTDVIHPDSREIVKERIRQTHEEEVAAPYLEMKFLRLDGTEVDVTVVAIPTTYQGNPAVQVVTQDITDRKRIEETKDHFMSAVTHELRTPLTSLKGYLELLMNESGPLPGQIQSDLEVMKRNTDRLLNLTNDVLDIQRMRSGKLQLNLEKLDLRKVIDEAVDEISPLTAAKKQSLIVEHPQQKLPIYGDQMRLSQVLMNLLSNATKFAPEGDKIIISTRADDNLITIAVSDTGIGIRKEDLNIVFDPFAAIRKPTYIKGTGLGLSIVKGLVEAHGGKIWVESRGEGRGATFTFKLPMRSSSTEQITTAWSSAFAEQIGKNAR